MTVSGLCLGVPEENSGKVLGKSLEKTLPESRNATNYKISGTRKGKPAQTLGRLYLDVVPIFRAGVFFEIDSSSLLECF